MAKQKLSWTVEGQALVHEYLKKNKKSNQAIMAVVGTQPGQILFQAEAGRTSNRDWMSIGSLFCALDAALDQLHKILKAKTPSHFQSAAGVWFERSGPWIIIGSGVRHQPSKLKTILKHLKKRDKNTATSPNRPSGSLSATQLDATIEEQWG